MKPCGEVPGAAGGRRFSRQPDALGEDGLKVKSRLGGAQTRAQSSLWKMETSVILQNFRVVIELLVFFSPTNTSYSRN